MASPSSTSATALLTTRSTAQLSSASDDKQACVACRGTCTMNGSQRISRLAEAIENHPDVLQAIIRLAREMSEFPSTKHLETHLWPAYSNRLRREDFRCLCRD